jgi:hypothetical protein
VSDQRSLREEAFVRQSKSPQAVSSDWSEPSRLSGSTNHAFPPSSGLNALGPLAVDLNNYAQLSRNWDGRGAEPFDISLIFEILRLSESVVDSCRQSDSKPVRLVSRPHPDGSIEVEFMRADRTLSLRLHPGLQLDIQRKGAGCPSEILVYSAGVTLAVSQAAGWLTGQRPDSRH